MKRLRVRPGFWLLAGLLLLLDRGVGLLGWGLLAAVCHEGGHLAVGRLRGRRLKCLELTAAGARMEFMGERMLGYGEEMAVALAGPAVNLLLGWGSAAAGAYLFAAANFALAGVNLLPILPLDGGRTVWCAVTSLAGEGWSGPVLTLLSALVTGLFAGFAAVAAVHYGNLSLLVVAGWLFWLNFTKKEE